MNKSLVYFIITVLVIIVAAQAYSTYVEANPESALAPVESTH